MASLNWRALDLPINFIFAGLDKSQPLVKTQRSAVGLLHVQADRKMAAVRLLQQLTEEPRSDSLAAEFTQQRDIHQQHETLVTLHQNASDRTLPGADDPVVRAGIRGFIPVALRPELHAQKSFFLASAPSPAGPFFLPAAGIDG